LDQGSNACAVCCSWLVGSAFSFGVYQQTAAYGRRNPCGVFFLVFISGAAFGRRAACGSPLARRFFLFGIYQRSGIRPPAARKANESCFSPDAFFHHDNI
jgi:hypothetical protein